MTNGLDAPFLSMRGRYHGMLMEPSAVWNAGLTPDEVRKYVHSNRVIRKYDLNMIYVAGPGSGGPGMAANTYLEGTYSELF